MTVLSLFCLTVLRFYDTISLVDNEKNQLTTEDQYMNNETVIVLDFGGQYNQLIARRVRECVFWSFLSCQF